MLYSTITSDTINGLLLQPIWYAGFTDHPKYTIEFEIYEQSISDLVILPTFAIVTECEIYTQDHGSSKFIDVEVRVGDRVVIVKYGSVQETETFNLLNEHGCILGDTKQEVFVEMENQLIGLIEEYLDWNDRERFRWYVECLEKINPEKSLEYVDKHPELFV